MDWLKGKLKPESPIFHCPLIQLAKKHGRRVDVSPNKASWWCNNHLEKYESQWVSDDIPYMKWKIKAVLHVPNHQPVIINHD